MALPEICYLCAEKLAKPVNVDHVPALQMFPTALRKEHGPLQLLTITVTPVSEAPPDHFAIFMKTQPDAPHGKYPGAFSYRFDKYDVQDADAARVFHHWALLLWDRVLVTVIFHDSGCGCDDCTVLPTGGQDAASPASEM
jgi:hypothetical protein